MTQTHGSVGTLSRPIGVAKMNKALNAFLGRPGDRKDSGARAENGAAKHYIAATASGGVTGVDEIVKVSETVIYEQSM